MDRIFAWVKRHLGPWRLFVLCLGFIVAAGTSYMLARPGLTVDMNAADDMDGLVVETSDEAALEEAALLIEEPQPQQTTQDEAPVLIIDEDDFYEEPEVIVEADQEPVQKDIQAQQGDAASAQQVQDAPQDVHQQAVADETQTIVNVDIAADQSGAASVSAEAEEASAVATTDNPKETEEETGKIRYAVSPLYLACPDYEVWFSFDESDKLPESTSLSVKTYTAGSSDTRYASYFARVEEKFAAYGDVYEETVGALYELKLTDSDGNEVVPAHPVDIEIALHGNSGVHQDEVILSALYEKNTDHVLLVDKNYDNTGIFTTENDVIKRIYIKDADLNTYDSVVGLFVLSQKGAGTEGETEEAAEEATEAGTEGETEAAVEATEKETEAGYEEGSEEVTEGAVEEDTEEFTEAVSEAETEEVTEEATETATEEVTEEVTETVTEEATETVTEEETEEETEDTTEEFTEEESDSPESDDAHLTRTVISSMGRAYRVKVTYGSETGIPEDADLVATEIKEGSSLYDTYVAYSEDALGMEEGSAGYIRLFDISIVDKNDHSIKYQPKEGTTVDVKIELADSESDNELSIVHFADGSKHGDVIESEINGQTVSFSADGFSVYSVVSRENANGNTALDGGSYVLVTGNNALLMGETLASDNGKLAAIQANPTVGGTLQVNGRVTMWSFEAVPGEPGWYYISDGNGNYLNITSTSGSGGTVTLGNPQAIYVATKGNGSDRTYQLRTRESQSGSKAVNNYGNTVTNGFGAWTAGNGNNEWFRLYTMEFLGDVKISFDKNGGTGNAPDPVWGLDGDTITLPDYTGTRNGYTFLGWSTGKSLANNTYYPVYPAGSEYTIPEKNTTLYAVWTENNLAQGNFYIRLDGTIPYEPDQYDSSAYTSAITITGAIKKRVWITDNDVNKPNNGLYIENNVTAELNQVPDITQLVNNINGSASKLGFRVKNDNGDIVVSEITDASTNSKNYNLSEGDSLYVLWYVQKYAGSWHVDGTLLVKNKVNIAYDGNAPDGSVRNVPLGYQESVGTEVPIGASGSKNGTVKTPTRPGYIFLGWNLKPDGSGTWYQNNDEYTLNEDTTLYAQWSKGTNMMTVSKTNEDGETLAGAQFKLEEKTASGTFIEKANRTTGTNGIFTYDQMENDTLYRMTETYAPDGYEVQNSFFFKVAVSDSDSTKLQLHVCDENGNFLSEEEKPDWLRIEYIPADDPRAQGVARIQFNIRDERIKRSIRFIKTDEEGNPLSEAEYTLKNSKDKEVTGVLKEASDSNGVFSVDDAVLAYGSYTLTEDKAPVGYAIGDPVTLSLNDYVDASNIGLTITGGNAAASCEVTSVTEQGLTTTTYAYTVTVKDEEQAHINVTKAIGIDSDLQANDLNTTIYYALTKKGEEGYVKKKNGDIWIETMNIVGGVPTPSKVVFDGVDYGEYDVWEMALIGGEYTRMYNGLVVGNFQLDSVGASSADGGNNANVSADDLEAQVDFTNWYGKITQSTSFIANKEWTGRDGTTKIDPPEGAVIEFTLYSEKKDASGKIIAGTQEKVRSIELDGVHDPDGEDEAWQAVFKYLPIYYEGNLEYSYKVKETVTVDGYYPNNYPQEYYLTSSGGTITNRKLTTDVELHKKFEIFPEDADLLSNTQNLESLSLTLTKPDGTETAYSLSDFAASAEDPYDYVLTLKDLPLGEYSFSEAGQDSLFADQGYKLVYSVSSAEGEGQIEGTEQPVLKLELENSYAKEGTLVVKKNNIIYEAVDEQTAPEQISGKKFAFVVKRGSRYLQEDGTLGTDPYMFTLTQGESREFTNIPAGRYTVIEQNASVEGYVWEVVGGTSNDDGSYSKSLTIDDANSAGEAAFDNRYTKIENASLTVSKNVAGGPEEAVSKEYQVEITTIRHGDTTMWLDASGNLSEERQVLTITQGQGLSFASIPAGTYTITENEEDAAFKDYSLEVKYTCGDASDDTTDEASGETPGDTSGGSAGATFGETAGATFGDDTAMPENTITIHKDQQAEVVITNTYDYQYTPVKITKTVTGNMGDKDLYFGFDVYVKDAEGRPLTVDGVTDENGKVLSTISLKDGEERTLEKLPKGAVLTIVEHNEHYETTVNGFVGVDESLTSEALSAVEAQSGQSAGSAGANSGQAAGSIEASADPAAGSTGTSADPAAGNTGTSADPAAGNTGTSADPAADTTETYSFIIPDKGATVHFINDHTVQQNVILKKVGFNNTDSSSWNLEGATFRIYEDEEKTKPVELDGKTEFTSDENGLLYSGILGAGTYYLDETVVPGGYNSPLGMLILEVGEDGVTLRSAATSGQPDLNDWITSETKVVKEGSEGSEGSGGTGETGATGDIQETGDTGDTEGTEETVYTVSIRNIMGVTLPSTGGPGTSLIYLFGAILTSFAGAGLVMKRRRNEV